MTRNNSILDRLTAVIAQRRTASQEQSYVARLVNGGEDLVLKKIGEEATETVMAAKDGDATRVVAEVADLWFHCMCLLARHERSAADVLDELGRREGMSGLDEKAARQARGGSPESAGPAAR